MFTRILLRLLAPIQREPAFFCCMLVLSAFAVQANPLNRRTIARTTDYDRPTKTKHP